MLFRPGELGYNDGGMRHIFLHRFRGSLSVPNAIARGRHDLLAAVALVALVACFWAPWLVRGRVPVPAAHQARMQPWSASAPPVNDTAQWDALWWDGVAQFYPWRIALHRWLQRGEWPLWSDTQLCGYPLVGNGQSAMFYPPNWLYGLVHPRTGFAVSSALHMALALLLAFAYCRRVGLTLAAASYAGIAYAFGGFMVGWVPLPTLMNSAAWLPGCLLGVELVMRGRGPAGSAVLAACGGMAILAGHLQIAAYVLLATAAYALARVAHRLWHRRRTRAGWLAVGGVMALALGCAQLLPSLELGLRSTRGGGEATAAVFEFHQASALQRAELVTLALPDALGNPARGDYQGSLHARGAAYGERCGYVGLVTLVLGLFGLVAGKQWWRWALAAAAALTLWAAMGGLPAWLLFYGVPKIGLAGGFTRLLCLYTLWVAVLGGLGLRAVEETATRASAPLRKAGRLIVPLAICVLVIDLFSWAWRTVPSAPAERIYAPTPVTDWLGEQWEPGDRMLAITRRADWTLYERPRALLPPNSATAYEGLASVQGYDSLFPANFRRFAVLLEGEECAPLANGNMVLLENVDSCLLDLAGVRWVLSESDLSESERLAPVAEVGGVLIYRNLDAYPRAFLTDSGGGEEALGRLGQRRQRAPEPVEADLGASCNRLTAEVPRRPGLAKLVVTNTFFPGWVAWKDGQRVEVGEVAEVFQGVELPPGAACRILLAYVPTAVGVGLFLALLAALAIAALLAYSVMRPGAPGSGAGAEPTEGFERPE